MKDLIAILQMHFDSAAQATCFSGLEVAFKDNLTFK